MGREFHTTMAVLARTRSAGLYSRFLSGFRAITTTPCVQNTPDDALETVTHTGQVFQPDDYRRSRFINKSKLVTEKWAIDMVAEEPVVVSTKRVVSSCSGGALGHPKVFINLDQPKIRHCGYSGRKFVLKKYYDEKTMGPSITYEQYLEEIGKSDD